MVEVLWPVLKVKLPNRKMREDFPLTAVKSTHSGSLILSPFASRLAGPLAILLNAIRLAHRVHRPDAACRAANATAEQEQGYPERRRSLAKPMGRRKRSCMQPRSRAKVAFRLHHVSDRTCFQASSRGIR